MVIMIPMVIMVVAVIAMVMAAVIAVAGDNKYVSNETLTIGFRGQR
ncbi:MAG: hypothetical protein ACP5SH_26785 [Syntrophobacteraceae bacterium]